MKLISNRWGFCWSLAVFAVAFIALPQLALGVVPVVKTVPMDPNNSTTAHTACPASAVTLKGTSSLQGALITFDWDFGDGSAHATGTVTDQNNVSATHTYAGSNLQNFTAILKITDTSNGDNASANYLVQFVTPCTLAAQVNIAIDEGLWYLHKIMWRSTSGATLGSVGAIPIGGWDVLAGSPGNPAACDGGFRDNVFSGAFAGCDNFNFSGVINADNVQAFEVNSHLANGPASDPYTDDMVRGGNRMLQFLAALPVSPHTINFNAPPTCPNGATTPCSFTFDGNGNGQAIDATGDNLSRAYYEGGQFMDALVASGTPNATAATGPAGVAGLTYQNIVQDLVDRTASCQYSFGGSWIYGCNAGNDNSTAQWAAIGLIAAARGFSLTLPPIVKDADNVWVTNSQQANGVFGYQNTSPVWGPFATTPSGMVQMAMDDVGRGDMRWDRAEAFYRDNFCNNPNSTPGNAFNNAVLAPRAYTYGMFSFTKGMLLHNPGGVLTPIKNLQDVITIPTPPPPIDWYGAEASAGAPCDGVARSLVDRQGLNGGYPPTPAVPTSGFWIGHSTAGNHFPFETAWSIIMLQKTVFIKCVTNLYGRGTPSGRAATRVDLTWAGINNVDHYDVLRGTVSGGPYVKVGSTTGVAFSDTNGLLNGGTYFYVLHPINAAGGEICESNEAKVTIPAGR